MSNFALANSTLNLIAGFEGFQPTAFWDYQQYSVGYGSGTMLSGKPVKASDTVTKAEALQMLSRDVQSFADSVNRLVTSNINRNQFDALVSFAYNLGAGNLQKSTLLKVVNNTPNDFASIRKEFLKWVTAGGVTLDGLVKRREKEADLYANGSVSPVNFIWLLLIGVFIYFFKK